MMRGIHKICGTNKCFLLEPYASSLHVSCNYVSAKQISSSQNLPKQPVPVLKDTLQKYLKSVRPHLTDDEFANTTNLLKDFEGGIGQKLQRLLEERAQVYTNWLEEWWLNTAYLEYRDPVVIFSSPGLVFPFQKFNNQDDQLIFAAKVLTAALDYKLLIDNVLDQEPTEISNGILPINFIERLRTTFTKFEVK